VVQEDADLAVIAALVAEGVLDCADVASGGAGEVVCAHRNAEAALELNLVVVVYAVGPALAAIDGEAAVLGVSALHNIAAHKVGHRLLRGRAEGELGGLGRLEENIAVSIRIELTSSLSRSGNVVAALLVDLGDVLDGASPGLLDGDDLGFHHRGRSVGEGDGRVVQEDADLAVIAALVAEGVLDCADVASGGAGEVVCAHRNAEAALELNLVVVVYAVGPALAAIDGEAAVLGVSALHNIAAHKVGHRLLRGRAEGELGGLGRLEENIAVSIRIELTSSLSRSGNVVAALLVDLGDVLDGAGPGLLHGKDLGFRHRGTGSDVGRGARALVHLVARSEVGEYTAETQSLDAHGRGEVVDGREQSVIAHGHGCARHGGHQRGGKAGGGGLAEVGERLLVDGLLALRGGRSDAHSGAAADRHAGASRGGGRHRHSSHGRHDSEIVWYNP